MGGFGCEVPDQRRPTGRRLATTPRFRLYAMAIVIRAAQYVPEKALRFLPAVGAVRADGRRAPVWRCACMAAYNLSFAAAMHGLSSGPGLYFVFGGGGAHGFYDNIQAPGTMALISLRVNIDERAALLERAAKEDRAPGTMARVLLRTPVPARARGLPSGPANVMISIPLELDLKYDLMDRATAADVSLSRYCRAILAAHLL